MKPGILIALLSAAITTQPALAEAKRTPIKDAEVVVFDVTCTPTSTSEGYLHVDLQVDLQTDRQRETPRNSFFVRGTFYSYSATLARRDPANWHLIPLRECRDLQATLSQQVGRPIFLSGEIFETAYETYEDVWGTCRNHPMEGGRRPCKKGTRKVTKTDQEVALDLNGTYIINKNN